MNEVIYDDNGEPLEAEDWTPEFKLPPFLGGMNRTREEVDACWNETVMNYRRRKSPSKLSDMERASLEGRPWSPPLNKRQRERLKAEETAV